MRVRKCLTGLLLCAAAAATQASESFCVDSVSELQLAFNVAKTVDVPGGLVIQVVQGSYNLTGSTVLDATRDVIRSDLQVIGGYDPTCAARSTNADLTVFSSASTDLALNWSTNRDLRIDGISFIDFNSQVAVSSWIDASGTVDISLRNVAIREGTSNTGAGAPGPAVLLSTFGAADTNFRLSNVIVADRVIGDSQHQGSFCAVSVQGDGTSDFDEHLTVVNSTIARNEALNTSFDIGLCLRDIQADLYNSILYFHDAHDLAATSSLVNLYQNVIGDRTGFLIVNEQGTLTTSPQFNADLSLNAASPAVNSGTSNVAGGLPSADLVGNPRVVGIAIDRGAYENANQGLFAYTVTNGNDSGPGSLRQAMIDAQATPGTNAILFNIPGSVCPRTIDLQALLPDITQSLVIDGSSQPGFIGNSNDFGYNGTRCIVVRRGGGSNLAHSLRVPDTAPATTSLTVDSLAFGGFSNAINLQGGSGHRIVGSQFGGMVGSVVSLFPNTTAVRVTNAATGVTIGGDEARAVNVISAGTTGVLIGTDNNSLVNNFIGTSAGGLSAVPNTLGIVITSGNNLVRDNLIAGNSGVGLTLIGATAAGNQVFDNRIGIKRQLLCALITNNCPLPNQSFGIETASGASDNLIYNNIIAYNDAAGIRISSGSGNRVTFNQVYENSGPEVDIADAGYDFIDNDAAIPLPDGNGGQNAPSLTTPSIADQLTIRGSLNSRNGTYQIVFYDSTRCDTLSFGVNRGQAQRPLESQTVTISNAPAGANGSVGFSHTFVNRPTLNWLSAQARRLSEPGRNNVSEIGNCVELPVFADGFE